MYSRFYIQTRLSAVEAEDAIERLVRPKIGFLEPDVPTLDVRPFAGTVENGAFKCQRVITGRNSFLPIIVGHVAQAEGGAIVYGHMRLAFSVVLFMLLWMGMAMTMTYQELPKAITQHDLLASAGALAFPAFGIFLTALGYYPERHKALRLLRDALRLN